jgi:SAM-dependent methyltransferase
MLNGLRVAAKSLFLPILYRYPPIGLQPAQLEMYLHEILMRRDVPGDVAEIGCSAGGTACLAAQVVSRFSNGKRYVCFDTFTGFVESQAKTDLALGTPASALRGYGRVSKDLVRKILDLHGRHEVELVQGDIAQVNESILSEKYSVVLLDVDLSEPTYEALKKFYPLLSPGGIILVDDCVDEPQQRWRARKGFEQFCTEFGLPVRMEFDFGVIEKMAPALTQ